MDRQAFYKKIEEICECDSGEIQGSEELSYNGILDSISMLGLLATLDKDFMINISPDEILNIGTVDSLYDRIHGE